LSWIALGLTAYGEGVPSPDIAAFSWDQGGPYLAGWVILAAAIYELTPLKDVCLSRCCSPLDFLTGRLARRRRWSTRVGARARRLVRRLLLGADGGPVRSRSDEHRLDGLP
jgi:predicted metal-binding membrane protein